MKRMRFFCLGGVAIALLWTSNPLCYSAETEHADIKAEITKRHDEAVKRLQDWIAQISIAAEDRGYPEGAEYMAKLARDAGFQNATVINTDGKPGVFATLDAGAPKTVGLYFMYDVKQFDPVGVVVAADRSANRGQTATWQSDDRSRRGEPEGTGSGVSRCPARNSRRGKEDAGKSGDGGRRRRGDRFAAHPATR